MAKSQENSKRTATRRLKIGKSLETFEFKLSRFNSKRSAWFNAFIANSVLVATWPMLLDFYGFGNIPAPLPLSILVPNSGVPNENFA